MKKCNYCGGYGPVNSPLEKFTNAQGFTECWRHKDVRDCIWSFRFSLEKCAMALISLNPDVKVVPREPETRP